MQTERGCVKTYISIDDFAAIKIFNENTILLGNKGSEKQKDKKVTQ